MNFQLEVDPLCDIGLSSFEVVERKGAGHPDTLADGISELCSINYSRYCLDNFGFILHHNLDKVAVFGGLASLDCGGGTHVRPLRVVFGGRASMSFGGRAIPTRDILEHAAKEYLKRSLPGIFPTVIEYVHYTSDSSKNAHWFNPRDRTDLPEIERPYANDTAYLVGGSPGTKVERTTLAIEHELRRNAWAGSDIKVLIVRRDNSHSVTVCVPVLATVAWSAADYNDAVDMAHSQVTDVAHEAFQSEDVQVAVNNHCRILEPNSPPNAGYVTLSGSAIDFGEDGLVGRGNSRTGTISPMRRHGTEVLFGKNPVYQVGKVYGHFADKLAKSIALNGLAVECVVCTRNGNSISDPGALLIRSNRPIDPAPLPDMVQASLSLDVRLKDIVLEEMYVPGLSANDRIN